MMSYSSLLQNPNFFEVTDTCYILSFSVIMLNTALHNPNVKGPKITVEQFVKQNRGINSGRDLPKDILVSNSCRELWTVLEIILHKYN